MNPEHALALARRFHVHAGMTDKAGEPYIGHVERVAAAVSSDDEKVVAALHDLLEDTPLTPTDLLAAGVPPRLVAAVEALTRGPGESYEAFVHRAAGNPIARAVKRADVADNADESRLAALDAADAARLRKKYARARALLDEAHGRDDGVPLEVEHAELLMPVGHADAWTTFFCTECPLPSGTVALIDSHVVSASFLSRTCWPLADFDAALRGEIAAGDVHALWARDPEYVGFWCRRCEAAYCRVHWRDQEMRFDDGFFDDIRGTCPRGHRQTLDD
jgi:hypothetical protein